MKYKGISRTLDSLGRIVIPKEARRELGWGDHALLDSSQFGVYVLVRAHADETCMPIGKTSKNPICQEIIRQLSTLPAEDALFVLQLVQRLGQTAGPSDNQP